MKPNTAVVIIADPRFAVSVGCVEDASRLCKICAKPPNSSPPPRSRGRNAGPGSNLSNVRGTRILNEKARKYMPAKSQTKAGTEALTSFVTSEALLLDIVF